MLAGLTATGKTPCDLGAAVTPGRCGRQEPACMCVLDVCVSFRVLVVRRDEQDCLAFLLVSCEWRTLRRRPQ